MASKNKGQTKQVEVKEVRGKGQPRTFKDADFFLACVVEYVDYCTEKGRMPTLIEFCVWKDGKLKNFRMNRDTFNAQKEYYSVAYDIAKGIIESEVWQWPNATGVLYLKNTFGVRDKIETENVNLNHEMTEDEADEILKRFK